MLTREAVAQAYRDAADMLASDKRPEDFECCGIPLSELGVCQHRGYHPTQFNVAIVSYPEAYTEKGKLL